jgi:hypothetical protein
MKILRNYNNINLLINNENYYKNDLGWVDNFKEYEKEIVLSVVNPIQNFEMYKYNHNVYTQNNNIEQNDLWLLFKFYNNSFENDYTYNNFDIYDIIRNNETYSNSFFRLEFYKTENNDKPTRFNRKLVSTTAIPTNYGEYYYNKSLNNYIQIPLFISTNFKNADIQSLFWFQNEENILSSLFTGNTFWITAKFFNSNDGFIYDFINNNKTSNIKDTEDTYFKLIIDKENFTYSIYNMNDDRVGTSLKPLIFYQKNG